MAAESLVEAKFKASEELARHLIGMEAPLLAAYWDFYEDVDRWSLVLVPRSDNTARKLIDQVSELLIQPPYRHSFSLSDPVVDSHQIDRARALGDYIRYEPFVGRRMDMTFSRGEYFESVIPVYIAPELMTHLRVA